MKRSLINLMVCIVVVVVAMFTSVLQRTVLSEETGLQVDKFAFCEDIKDRKPVGENEIFPVDVGKVYCWMSISAEETPTEIKHVWYYGEKEMLEVPLKIEHQRSRTWSHKNIPPEQVGSWYVEIIDAGGNVLTKAEFIISTSTGIESKKEVKEKKVKEKKPEEQAKKKEPEADMRVEVKLGTDIEMREIVGEAKEFSVDVGRVYCWSLVEKRGGPTTIRHFWYYGDKKMAEIRLRIRFPRTRTWSYKTILPKWIGDWHIDVAAEDGSMLKRISFKITPE